MEKPQMDLTRDQKIARQSSELRALREQQIAEASGEAEPDLVPANRKPEFKIRRIEADGFVHVFTRIKNLSQDQKNFINEDRIIPIHAREFDKRVKDGAFTTYDEVEVIHDPRKNAPKSYEMKPEQLDVNKAASAPKADGKEVARKAQQIEKEFERLSKIHDSQIEREKAIAAKEAEIAAREKALQEAEAKPTAATVTAAPSAPVADIKVAVEPSTTAAAPDKAADKAKK